MREKAEFEQWYTVSDPWNFDNSTVDECRTNIILDYIKNGSFRNLLDVGCGEGVLTAKLSPYIEQIKAFDISENAIARAKQNFSNIKNIEFFQSDLRDIRQYSDRKFDIILCIEVLYYLNNKEREEALKLISYLLEDNGLFILNVVVTGKNEVGDYFDFIEAKSILSDNFKVINIFPSVLGKNMNIFKRIFLKILKLSKKEKQIRDITLTSDLSECYQAGFICLKR